MRDVPGQLSQMRGVLSVLGLEQASHAVLRMRDSVEQMLETEVDEQRARAAGTFDHLGNNLGALSFLIDMLNYQPALAKKLFVYDEAKGELRPLMGRTQRPDDAATVTTAAKCCRKKSTPWCSLQMQAPPMRSSRASWMRWQPTPRWPVNQASPGPAHEASIAVSGQNSEAAASALNTLVSSMAPVAAAPVAQVEAVDFEEDDLRDIFLEEAREVAGNGQAAIASLQTTRATSAS